MNSQIMYTAVTYQQHYVMNMAAISRFWWLTNINLNSMLALYGHMTVQLILTDPQAKYN